MNESNGAIPTSSPETLNLNTPRLLTSREVSNIASGQGISTDNSDNSRLETFMHENVTGIRMKGANVLIVRKGWDESEGVLDEELRNLIRSQKTKVVVTEYFEPELKMNMQRNPLLRQILQKLWESPKEISNTRRFLNAIEEEAREDDKTIAVSDIANKPAFLVNFSVPVVADIVNFMIANAASTALTLSYTGMFIYNRIAEARGKGIFDKDKIHDYERLLFDTEDARRVFAARGIEQLTQEYGNPNVYDHTEGNLPQILVIYPRAHAIRIANYLLHRPSIKNLIYRVYRGLDFSVRQYGWKSTLAKATSDNNLAGWRKVSDRRIPLM